MGFRLSFLRVLSFGFEVHLFGHRVTANVVSVSLAALSVFIVSRIVKLLNGIKVVSNLPGIRAPFQPLALPGALFPTSWWNSGLDLHWARRFQLYKESEVVSVVPFLRGVPGLYTSNLDVARQVSAGGHRSPFIKPETASQALLLWGMNLVAAEGETWRKHRRIMGPAFNSKLYQLVWTQTLRTYKEMISAEGWNDKDVVDVPVIQKLTFKLALLVIGTCGFGFSFNWGAPPKSSDGSMSVQEALRIVADTHMLAISLPKWAWYLPIAKLREGRIAHEILSKFMKEQVATRKAEIDAGKPLLDDAFSMLVKANQSEASKYQMDDQELIGNVFVLLFAGHETTAHTFAATLGFLGLYNDIQEEVLEQIISVIGPERDPAIEDYPRLDKVLAVFYEALRLFPAGHIMIREATEDTVLNIPNSQGEDGTRSIPVPKGLQVIVDMVGVQYNPRYFEEPEKFKPSRWYGLPSDSELFTAFSVGPRACIGRKFATTEAVCFLSAFLRDWKVEPALRPGETPEAWRDRVLDASIILTLGVQDVPVRFLRRKRT